MPRTTLLASVFAATFALTAGSAHASNISYDVRSITNGSFSDYQAAWASQSSTINSRTLSAFDGVTGGNSSYDYLRVDFSVSSPQAGRTFAIQLAPDAGYGGALYLDGVLLDVDHSDLWWGGSWNSASELLSASLASLTSGSHVLEAYWAEACCNGGQSGRFSVGGGAWQTLTVSNLDALAVPEPATLALLGIGLAGLGLRRRKSR